MTNAWREPADAVELPDAAAAGRLAREAASPFGRKLAAADLLARFGGDTPAGRRRAQAALELAGVAVEPPLATVEPQRLVTLRPAAPMAAAGPGGPVVAVVPPRRRAAVAALGLLGLLVVLVGAMLLRPGGDDERGGALAGATSTATAPPARTTPPAAPTAPARIGPDAGRPTRGAAGAAPSAARRVRLRIVPTEPSYVCVAEDDGTPIVRTMLARPLTVARPRLRFRIGVLTARITADGRRVAVAAAPAGFRVTPRGTRPLPPGDPVCR